jgi:hypothetical protein
MKRILFSALAVLQLALAGQDGGLEQQAFFSGMDYTLETKFGAPFFGKDENPELIWVLSVNSSDLASGRISPENQKINFKVNDLRPGITVAGNLRFGSHARRRPVAVYFFARDPFPELRRFKRFSVGLYPADSPLNSLLENYDFEYEKIEAPEKFRGQVLFISGVDFDKNPKLLDPLLRRLPRGRKIVVLPPVSGTLKFPASMFTKTTLLPPNGIQEMRREFDALPLAYNINMQTSGDSLTLKFSDKGQGSGGVVLDTRQGGKLIFSGWSLDDLTNPTGIYLLRYHMRPDIR